MTSTSSVHSHPPTTARAVGTAWTHHGATGTTGQGYLRTAAPAPLLPSATDGRSPDGGREGPPHRAPAPADRRQHRCSSIACLGAAGGLSFVRAKLSEVQVVSLRRVARAEADVRRGPQHPADRHRQRRPPGPGRLRPATAVRTGGLLADVIMVLRLDPKKNKAVAPVDPPRHLRADRRLRLRAARSTRRSSAANGAERLIQTIKQNFGDLDRQLRRRSTSGLPRPGRGRSTASRCT